MGRHLFEPCDLVRYDLKKVARSEHSEHKHESIDRLVDLRRYLRNLIALCVKHLDFWNLDFDKFVEILFKHFDHYGMSVTPL